ncbi:hypothetical protein DL766_003896 [Monosporascus sp. MC13-8B]|uniref:Inner centromere protein ARK-binding domain-containing protein n=1 Tax=Monosporascus cannonballus TaxID=155416 RepID=A0ABY0HHT5_9PEZI|nr:hypothetical protein DL762_001411 [Monosporascus cannonballus]RYP32571.1 hypothetical protein DL766_003896 [Monosporascus sp. MC13-8B]
MVGPRAARLPVGSAQWITEERSSASRITESEVEEFSFSARNEFDWLNEHMAEIFSENQINVAEIFKTPGKLRGKTPRTVRKANPAENRVPLSNIFSSTPKGAPNPFSISNTGRNNTPRLRIAADPRPSPAKTNILASPSKPVAPPKSPVSKQPVSVVDSGYYGSQSQDAMNIDDVEVEDEPTRPFDSPEDAKRHGPFYASSDRPEGGSPARTSPPPAVENAADENMADDLSAQFFTDPVDAGTSPTCKTVPQESTTPAGSPVQHPLSTSPTKSSPTKTSPAQPAATVAQQPEVEPDTMDAVLEGSSRSPSDGSSPIRPIVRKSSLNFASLPAREPITHKSIGNRVSRTSHLDQHRTSYYNRHTGGKSLGHGRHELSDDENDDMDVDEEPPPQKSQPAAEPDTPLAHNKTYTQRLQDQINKLGQPQTRTSRPSKSIPDAAVTQQVSTAVSNPPPEPQRKPLPSPKKPTTPGAFPEDDDEWIEPLGTPDDASGNFSPRPGMPKSYSADVMEGVAGKKTVGGDDFVMPEMRQLTSSSKSPERPPVPEKSPDRLGHQKSASVPVLPQMSQVTADDVNPLKKTVSVSDPPLATVFETGRPTTPKSPKSPSRGFRDSPLKQVKNKLSSILKSSKGLLASSAAASAEGKTSLLSPSTLKLGLHGAPSTESLKQTSTKDSQPLYPDLSRHATDNQTIASTASPARTEGRRTRASIEREKAEEKRREKEAKEARRMAEQMEKLEKAREKEREKARVYSEEQEKAASIEKQVAAQREQEKMAVPPTPKQAQNVTYMSPRKTKAQFEADSRAAATSVSDDQPTDDVQMVDAPNPMPPPSAPRSAAPPSATKVREIKRPVKPAKEPVGKAKQAPTVIRVNMNSQNSQHQPSNSALSSNLHDTLGPSSSQSQLKNKASQSSLHAKQSLAGSLKGSVSSTGRPKALEMAARRKEQEEREAQRKRDAKAEMERKRAALQEEERRQEQQRKLEAERQREEERRQAEAKKNMQRQAMLEKAKQTRAPPPAVRNQAHAPPEHSRPQDQLQKGEVSAGRPPSRLNTAVPRSQEDLGRPVNATLSSTSKASSKRPLQPDENSDKATRQAPSRPGTIYQTKESKRMRMTDEFDDADVPSKSIFPAGYTSAAQSATRDLFKATVTSQHNGHAKATHPMDMAQFSKGAIPFAPNPAGPSHKTPARPQGIAGVKSAAKSATRSSPRFQNGESIELPEINTDDEDSDDDDGGKDVMAAWADSPNLRRALVEQESKDPFQIFGAPGPLNMEEVFAKSKDRFHKFRARTSSANWSGLDRLTEDDIRKDLAAREKMRREGGWTYEMSKELA